MRSNLKSIRLQVPWTSLVVQWLRLHAPREGGFDLWLGKSPHAMYHGQKEKEKKKKVLQEEGHCPGHGIAIFPTPEIGLGKHWCSGASLVAQWEKNPPAMQDTQETGSIAGLGRSPRGGKWQLTPVTLPGKSHGQRSLVGYSPKGRKGVHTTEQPPRQIKVLNKHCCVNGDEAPNLNEDTSQTRSSYPPC